MFITSWLLALLVATGAESSPGPVLLDFSASWCPPCQATKPEVAKLKAQGYPVRVVDVDESPGLAKRFRVSGIPTFIVVDTDGSELARTTGAKTAKELARFYKESTDSEEVETLKEPDDSEDENAERQDSEGTSESAAPWETVVRIKVVNHLSRPRSSVGFGSGTIVHSTEDESIILTCAHIFHIEEMRAQPPPSRFPLKVLVDLFDGRLSKSETPQVHTTEVDLPAEVIDFDAVGDVGLIRIRPARRLPVSKIVPPGWTPKPSQRMTTVGCSHGHDATAWSTWVTKPLIRLQKSRNAIYEATECAHKPLQGRSGGGLFTLDGILAGVCDFNDGPNGSHGLYASPRTIHKLLDRHNLQVCYVESSPDRDRGRTLLAGTEGRRNARQPVTVRGQSPSQEIRALPIPSPDLMNVRLPDVDQEVAASPSRRTRQADDSWHGREGNESGLTEPTRVAAEMAPRRHDTAGLQMAPSADGDLFAAAPDFPETRVEQPEIEERPRSRRATPDSWRSATAPAPANREAAAPATR